MNDPDILTEQQVVQITTGASIATRDLGRSHERLRGRLAEAERERDELRVTVLGETYTDAGTEVVLADLRKSKDRADLAEARLADAQAALKAVFEVAALASSGADDASS